MKSNQNRHGSYVGRVQEDTQRFVKELMQENEKLRLLATAMEQKNNTLQQQLHQLAAELDRNQTEKVTLRKQLEQIERETSRYSEQFAEVEQRSVNLANLYVSSYQLHGTLDREAVLTAIKEIVVNLVGSEELGVFEVGEDGSNLELVTSFGLDDSRYRRIDLTNDPIGKLAAAGETYLHGQSASISELPQLVACIPLKLDGRVMGAIVLFSLLGHKPGLEELDFELFDLLATHAATALYCTSLHSRMTEGAVA